MSCFGCSVRVGELVPPVRRFEPRRCAGREQSEPLHVEDRDARVRAREPIERHVVRMVVVEQTERTGHSSEKTRAVQPVKRQRGMQ